MKGAGARTCCGLIGHLGRSNLTVRKYNLRYRFAANRLSAVGLRGGVHHCSGLKLGYVVARLSVTLTSPATRSTLRERTGRCNTVAEVFLEGRGYSSVLI